MIYTVFSAICLGILILVALIFIISYLMKNRDEKITFIRQFKKGKCAIIYIAAIPLYFIGHIYNGQNVLKALANSFNKVMILVVLRYDISSIESLMLENSLFNFTVYFCFLLVLINAMLFTLSFLQQRIWAFFKRLKWRFTKKDKLLIFGYSKENIDIYNSEHKRVKMITSKFTDKETELLYRKKIGYIHNVNSEKLCEKIILSCSKYKSQKYLLIINTGDDEKNIKLCNSITKIYKKIILDENNPYSNEDVVDLFSRLRIYVFGNPAQETIYSDIVKNSYGSIRYINKYKKIASNFIKEHPFTQYMDNNQIDYETSLLKSNTDINVAFIGFGKTSQQIFLTSVANNQFLTKNKEGEVVLKPVNYYMFDKNRAENNKNLNYDYYRFKNEFKNQKSKSYLPLPALPAKESYNYLDVNDSKFFYKLKKIFAKDNNVNFVVIAFGSDLENIDMAVKILGKKCEWKIKNLTVFVKVRSGLNSCSIFNRNDCFMIGNEKNVVNNMNEIDEDIITEMSQKRNQIYALESKLTSNPEKKNVTDEEIKKIFLNADYSWHVDLTQIERESNIYACLSLRSKLHLMGLDYVEKNDKVKGLTEDEYLNIYAKNDFPKFINKCAKTKKIIEYPLDFKDSKRKNLAIQEHYRWNSFMISKGIVPASKNEILKEKIIVKNKEKFSNGKSYIARRHGNLTTFDGLIEFRKLLAIRDNAKEIDEDVIKYDYQLLDDAYWLLNDSNYAIIKREK